MHHFGECSGIDLDPLSMAALLMAVGFSVDFTSHLAYHYYKSETKSRQNFTLQQSSKYGEYIYFYIRILLCDLKKRSRVLAGRWCRCDSFFLLCISTKRIHGQMEAPVVGVSTIIAITPLTLKPSYLVMVFFKTIVVVCSLGMFHGLVVMPSILTAITQCRGKCKSIER
ncbi:hypothetical protein COOONC_19874 [Cooperia oncophora]